ncbi:MULTISPECIES: capsular biosynthesis protein [Achromobacter]|uniref:Capsular biosynthesis protein n=1 Tax=Alcaligenes xylosoxydans xylosoxydans TaxID=85698 RepID=A0A424W8Y5_ALCXX|nr:MULTISPECIES: capsular biosynthesis protein [Achromobacter]MBC9906814.1 capsular biosynthesis protein [Achromobacter xylosoxidans]MBD0870522.1 capsular biosynthesis protein [Achromobacter xylosoxidans]QNP85761.1 capsular biosynthesis protein [Achromobacter xylosoxidans]RPJ89756.1 capsular biosynthesis protein [Achromobacter xylosoxidans]
MIRSEKVLVFDVDGTLCEIRRPEQSYADVEPIWSVVDKLKEYSRAGFYIVLNSSRNMRTYQGNAGLLNANTLPVLVDWLKKHDIPFNEVHLGKPWPGTDGFYVDDRTIRPDEFCRLNYEEILALLGVEKGKE